MAPIARRTTALAGAAAASALAAQTFVLAPGGAVAPRAAGSASSASSQPSRAGFGGATALAAIGAAGVSLATGRRAVRMNAAKESAAKEGAAKEDVPPPPPPFDPSKQVGALPPLGFFDPLGFCKVGDEAGFRNLRAAELKHARVAMMAALGAVVQPAIKFPGFEEQSLFLLRLGYGFTVSRSLRGCKTFGDACRCL